MANINVKVGIMPGKMQMVTLDEGRTVADAIRVANINPSGYELKLNGQTTSDFNSTVEDGNTIFLVKMIKGNADYICVEVSEKDSMLPAETFGVEKNSSIIDVLSAYVDDICDEYDIGKVYVNGVEKEPDDGVCNGDKIQYTYPGPSEVCTESCDEDCDEDCDESCDKERGHAYCIAGCDCEQSVLFSDSDTSVVIEEDYILVKHGKTEVRIRK